ncbi:MAG: hypothetical protein IAF38_08000 [Bacteroidia bacterium]|nr:hypothetical protein [Bacteroidia bacterium]
MKKILFIVGITYSLSAIPGNLFKGDDKYKYCAKLKDGKISIMHEEKEITASVALLNGTKILVDGTVLKPDGTKIKLKDGQCADQEGVIDPPETIKEKNKH